MNTYHIIIRGNDGFHWSNNLRATGIQNAILDAIASAEGMTIELFISIEAQQV